MIVRDFYVVGVPFPPSEAEAPSIVDPDAVLAGAITAESLQPVPRRDPEVIELLARIELDELSPGCPLHLQ